MSITGTHHRTASVVVVNDSGKPVRAVSVVHKYSDNYSDDHVWPDLGPGAESDPMQVRYNTGPFTTGRDSPSDGARERFEAQPALAAQPQGAIFLPKA